MRMLRLGATAVLALLLTAAPAVYAQHSGGQGQSESGSGKQISDGELMQFVKAQAQVLRITQDYKGRIQKTDSKGKAQSLKQEAQAKMARAVKETGLSVEKYNVIARKSSNDPSLRKRIDTMREKL